MGNESLDQIYDELFKATEGGLVFWIQKGYSSYETTVGDWHLTVAPHWRNGEVLILRRVFPGYHQWVASQLFNNDPTKVGSLYQLVHSHQAKPKEALNDLLKALGKMKPQPLYRWLSERRSNGP